MWCDSYYLAELRDDGAAEDRSFSVACSFMARVREFKPGEDGIMADRRRTVRWPHGEVEKIREVRKEYPDVAVVWM